MIRFHRRGSGSSSRSQNAIFPILAVLLGLPSLSAVGVGGSLAMAQSAVDEAMVEHLKTLMIAPMDDPRHTQLVRNEPPAKVVGAAAELGRQLGDRVAPLHVYLHGLAGYVVEESEGFEPILHAALTSTEGPFFPPDLIAALDQIVANLDAERISLKKRASIYERTGGIPLPRKMNLDPETGELSAYTHDRLSEERKTLVANEEQLTEFRRRYPLLMAEMGLYYERRSNLVMAFECFSRSVRLDYDSWSAQGARYDEAYLKTGSFMVLSAHRSDDVLAIYHLTTMDSEPLERLIVKQIDQRAHLYAKAADQYTNHASINKSLQDLLYTLIEDEGAIEFLPEKDRKEFLELIGKTALSKRHYQEAIGVYATLGNTKKLIHLGEKLSKNVYSTRRGKAFINRDMAWAMDAFREAGADDEMAALLDRVEAAKSDLERGKLIVDEPQLLATYWKTLNDYVHGSDEADVLILTGGGNAFDTATPTPEEVVIEASAEELPILIADYGSQVKKSIPGQDLGYIQSRLLLLGEQAERTQRLNLAVEAYSLSGPAGHEKATILIDELLKTRRHSEASRLLIQMGDPGKQQLRAMCDQILDRGIAPRGIYNPDVRYAVEGLIVLDDVDTVEEILNDLLRLKIQFSQLQTHAETAGRKVAHRNLIQLNETLRLIADAYDIVGLPGIDPAPTPASTSTSTPDPEG